VSASDIVLATINATWSHPSLGLRCLRANLGPCRERCTIVELDSRGSAEAHAERIAALRPKIVGLGVYIWNAAAIRRVAALLRRAVPDAILVLGGPEISHEWDAQPIAGDADFIVCGDGEAAFADLCGELMAGRRPSGRVMAGGRPELASLRRPYAEYTDEDLRSRFTYVETTRGCPFRCEFCLSSLDPGVRRWPLAETLSDLDRLIRRGARRLKFVDRTFNLEPDRAEAVLRFLLDRMQPGLVVHFELVPGRLPGRIRELLGRFPSGSLRVEVGVQTFDEAVAARVGRRQTNADVEETLRFLREETRAHVHADLLAGLPGEDLQSFGRGFDRLLAMAPAEIQVGILKRLRGTTIARHIEEWGMLFDQAPPYPVLRTRDLTERDLERVSRTARYWERLGNRGRFSRTLPLLWRDGRSPFDALLELSDALFSRFRAAHGIAEQDLVAALIAHLTKQGAPPAEIAAALMADDAGRGRFRLSRSFQCCTNGRSASDKNVG